MFVLRMQREHGIEAQGLVGVDLVSGLGGGEAAGSRGGG